MEFNLFRSHQTILATSLFAAQSFAANNNDTVNDSYFSDSSGGQLSDSCISHGIDGNMSAEEQQGHTVQARVRTTHNNYAKGDIFNNYTEIATIQIRGSPNGDINGKYQAQSFKANDMIPKSWREAKGEGTEQTEQFRRLSSEPKGNFHPKDKVLYNAEYANGKKGLLDIAIVSEYERYMEGTEYRFYNRAGNQRGVLYHGKGNESMKYSTYETRWFKHESNDYYIMYDAIERKWMLCDDESKCLWWYDLGRAIVYQKSECWTTIERYWGDKRRLQAKCDKLQINDDTDFKALESDFTEPDQHCVKGGQVFKLQGLNEMFDGLYSRQACGVGRRMPDYWEEIDSSMNVARPHKDSLRRKWKDLINGRDWWQNEKTGHFICYSRKINGWIICANEKSSYGRIKYISKQRSAVVPTDAKSWKAYDESNCIDNEAQVLPGAEEFVNKGFKENDKVDVFCYTAKTWVPGVVTGTHHSPSAKPVREHVGKYTVRFPDSYERSVKSKDIRAATKDLKYVNPKKPEQIQRLTKAVFLNIPDGRHTYHGGITVSGLPIEKLNGLYKFVDHGDIMPTVLDKAAVDKPEIRKIWRKMKLQNTVWDCKQCGKECCECTKPWFLNTKTGCYIHYNSVGKYKGWWLSDGDREDLLWYWTPDKKYPLGWDYENLGKKIYVEEEVKDERIEIYQKFYMERARYRLLQTKSKCCSICNKEFKISQGTKYLKSIRISECGNFADAIHRGCRTDETSRSSYNIKLRVSSKQPWCLVFTGNSAQRKQRRKQWKTIHCSY